MSTEITPDDERHGPSELEVAIVAKAKHADLYRAAKKVGGQSKLGRLCGVGPSEIGDWCNLRAMPHFELTVDKRGREHTSRFCDPAERDKLERVLFDVTGKLLDELFPPELRNNQEFLSQPKTQEFYTTLDLKTLGSNVPERFLLPDSSVIVAEKESKENLMSQFNEELKHLPYREREILRLRWGLNGSEPMGLEEIGHVFEITSERVRQIEAKAARKLEGSNKLKAAFEEAK